MLIKLRSRRDHALRAEISVPADRCTVAQLRRMIRDAAEMAAWPERMFSHWYVQVSKYLTAEIEAHAEEALLAEIGLCGDEGTVLLEVRVADVEDAPFTAAEAFAAAVVADQRCDNRTQATQRDVAALVKAMQEQQAEFNKRMEAQQQNAIKAMQQIEMLAMELSQASKMRSADKAKRQVLMTVATPCPPSAYEISYKDDLSKIECHEFYFTFSQLPKDRPFYLPKARISKGDQCLVEWRHSTKGAGLTLGFTHESTMQTAGGDRLNLLSVSDAVALSVYGTKVHVGGVEVAMKLPKISTDNPSRRIAVLLDLSDLTGGPNGSFRVFVSEDGTDANMKPQHDDAIKMQNKLAAEHWVPCGQVFGKASAECLNVFINDDIPRHYLSYFTLPAC